MQSSEIRKRFLDFFEKRGHAVIPSASLVTPNEKGVTDATLFNTAGMQPLIPYLLGKPHPKGVRLVDVQKCLRTVDIDDIGDKTHATFFEMLGNWSLGEYFKKEAINWSYEFLTDKKEGLGLNPKQLYITVFEGDENAPKDNEAADIWREIFKKNSVEGERIFFMGASTNWWEAGDNGPCGPDTEMFYDIAGKFSGKGITKEQFIAGDASRGVVEVWNDVFMQYEKKGGKIVGTLPKPSVDTGAGLERLAMTLQGVDNIFDTDLLKPVMDLMKKAENTIEHKRIIADHLRASVFLIGDGVVPSNTDRGYILRRLIRRAIISTTDKKLDEKRISAFVDTLVKVYEEMYPEFLAKKDHIKKVLVDEADKFTKTIASAIQEFKKFAEGGKTITTTDAFKLFSSYGLPIEMTKDLAQTHNIKIDLEGIEAEFKKHQDLSRAGAERKFKGGLADHNEKTVRLHTAHHLLLAALQSVLGKNVKQRGSNITDSRLRIDFAYDRKMTDEEKKKAESMVNEWIGRGLTVVRREMSLSEAEKIGAEMEFGAKYPDMVSVYFIEDEKGNPISKEFCGGPHVKNTAELGSFKIQKEEASSQGVRRIKAILE